MSDNAKRVDEILLNKAKSDKYIGERLINRAQGYPISKEYLATKSHAEIQERLQNDLSTSTNYTVEVEVNKQLIPLRVAKAYATELSRLCSEYQLLQAPLGKVRLGYIPEEPFEYGVTYFNHQSRQPKTLSLKEAGDLRSPIYAIDSSRCDKSRCGIATATHEFAHLLYSVRTPEVTIKPFEDELRKIHTRYKAEVAKAIDAKDYENMPKWYLGNYAENGIDEFMAEAFQEYKNCKKPTKYALEVGNLIDKFFKR